MDTQATLLWATYSVESDCEECDEAVFEPEVCATTYWVALLRYIGCTGHAHEVAEEAHLLVETRVDGGQDLLGVVGRVHRAPMVP